MIVCLCQILYWDFQKHSQKECSDKVNEKTKLQSIMAWNRNNIALTKLLRSKWVKPYKTQKYKTLTSMTFDLLESRQVFWQDYFWQLWIITCGAAVVCSPTICKWNLRVSLNESSSDSLSKVYFWFHLNILSEWYRWLLKYEYWFHWNLHLFIVESLCHQVV